jgi:hypothetical protein
MMLERLDPMERWNLALAGGGLVASFVFATPAFASSFALGAALEAVNFRALRASCARVLAGELAGARPWLIVLAHPIALLLGISTVVPAVLIVAWITRPPIDPTAPSLPPDDPSWDRWSVWSGREREPAEDES